MYPDAIDGVTYRDDPIPIPELIEELDEILSRPDQNRLDHPVIQEMEKGELSREQIAGWIYQITRWANPSNILMGAMYAKCPDDDLRGMILDNLSEEETGSEPVPQDTSNCLNARLPNSVGTSSAARPKT